MTKKNKKKDEEEDEITSEDTTVKTEGVKAMGVTTNDEVDIWSESALVSIAPIGKGEILYETRTSSLDPELGEKGVDFISNLKGGRLAKFTPMEDNEVTLDLYPLEAGTAGWPASGSNTTGDGMVDLLQGEDTNQPLSYQIDSLTRQKIRLTLLWTTDTSVSSTITTISTSHKALRMSFAEGYITKIDMDFTDNELMFTVTMTFPASDIDGNGACKIESCDDSAELGNLSGYTNSAMF